MMTHPASVFVIAFTAINVLACLWLMWWTSRSRPAGQADALPEPGASGGGPVGNRYTGRLNGVLLCIADAPNNSDHLVKPVDAIRAALGRH